jgi:hypothetical protein
MAASEDGGSHFFEPILWVKFIISKLSKLKICPLWS